MKRKKCTVGWFPVVALLGAFVPVVGMMPRKPLVDGPHTVEELVQQCRAGGATGGDLVNEATAAVARAYPFYSIWHLWESPEASLASHRGWSHQYNTVLLLVLRELGFDVRLVHAARVRGFRTPWWLPGHSWVKVHLGGHEVDVCASSETNTAGAVNFVPLTRELPMRRVTRWALGTWLTAFVVGEAWRAWLSGTEVSSWVYGRKQRRAAATPD